MVGAKEQDHENKYKLSVCITWALCVSQVGRQDGRKACGQALGCYYTHAADAGVWLWGSTNISFWWGKESAQSYLYSVEILNMFVLSFAAFVWF